MYSIGDWVTFYAPSRKREVVGRIHRFEVDGKAYIIQRTWDTRGHHFYVDLKRLRKVDFS